MTQFICKLCNQPKDSSQEVVTRYPTKTCRECWSWKVATGHRVGTTIAVDKCIRCGINPRPILDRKRAGVCDLCLEKEKNEKSGKQLIPRETYESRTSDQPDGCKGAVR